VKEKVFSKAQQIVKVNGHLHVDQIKLDLAFQKGIKEEIRIIQWCARAWLPRLEQEKGRVEAQKLCCADDADLSHISGMWVDASQMTEKQEKEEKEIESQP
jgi:hypothetical protein